MLEELHTLPHLLRRADVEWIELMVEHFTQLPIIGFFLACLGTAGLLAISLMWWDEREKKRTYEDPICNLQERNKESSGDNLVGVRAMSTDHRSVPHSGCGNSVHGARTVANGVSWSMN